jgi:hypothetical protein
MKRFCLAAVVLFLACSVSSLWADPAAMKIVRVGGSDPVNMVFDFQSNEFGGGYLEFFNDTDFAWSSLRIITGPALDPDGNPLDLGGYSFGGDPNDLFPFERAWYDDAGLLNILFGTNDSDHFLYSNQHFGIVLNDDFVSDGVHFTNFDPAGAGGWGSYHSFNAQANVPEPATCWLILTGLAGLGLVRKFRR